MVHIKLAWMLRNETTPLARGLLVLGVDVAVVPESFFVAYAAKRLVLASPSFFLWATALNARSTDICGFWLSNLPNHFMLQKISPGVSSGAQPIGFLARRAVTVRIRQGI